MTPNSSLTADEQERIAKYARNALVGADVLNVFPTPLQAVNDALNLREPTDLIAEGDLSREQKRFLSGISGKVLGLLDIRSRTVFIDRQQPPAKQRFTHAHELGHRALPWHEEAYFGDTKTTLDPDTAVLLEAEANTFSSDLLFNLDTFTNVAHAQRLGLAAALEQADRFQTSRSAAIRRYAEYAPRACAVLQLGRFPVQPKGVPSLKVLNGYESRSFAEAYGPITELMPALLPLSDGGLAADANLIRVGKSDEPICSGDFECVESRRGRVRMNYEVFFNQYTLFALIFPYKRIHLKRGAKVAWNEAAA